MSRMRRGMKDRRRNIPRTRWRIEGENVMMMQEVMAAMVRKLEMVERGKLREMWEGGQGQQCKGAMTREETRGRRRRRGRW